MEKVSFSFRYKLETSVVFHPREFLFVQQVCNSLTSILTVGWRCSCPRFGFQLLVLYGPRSRVIEHDSGSLCLLPSWATDLLPDRRDVTSSPFVACIWFLFFSVQKLKQGSVKVSKGYCILITNNREWLWTWRASRALQQLLHPDLQKSVMNSRWLLFWKDWACFKFNQ